MTIKLSQEQVKLIEEILARGARVELLIENGLVTIVEIRRKMRKKG